MASITRRRVALKYRIPRKRVDFIRLPREADWVPGQISSVLTKAEWKQNKQGKGGRPHRLSYYYCADGETCFLSAIESVARFSRLSI